MVDHLHDKEKAVGSIPTFLYKNAKTAPVKCEKRLMLDTQVNLVYQSSQGRDSL